MLFFCTCTQITYRSITYNATDTSLEENTIIMIDIAQILSLTLSLSILYTTRNSRCIFMIIDLFGLLIPIRNEILRVILPVKIDRQIWKDPPVHCGWHFDQKRINFTQQALRFKQKCSNLIVSYILIKSVHFYYISLDLFLIKNVKLLCSWF